MISSASYVFSLSPLYHHFVHIPTFNTFHNVQILSVWHLRFSFWFLTPTYPLRVFPIRFFCVLLVRHSSKSFIPITLTFICSIS